MSIDLPNLNADDLRMVIRAVSEWVRIRNDKDNEYEAELTPAEVQHSALLGRLLTGHQPLPKPPPRAYSYPWYDLIENGYAVCQKPWQVDNPAFMSPFEIVINQGRWKLLRREDEAYIVTHERAPGEWRVRPGTDEELDISGLRNRTKKGVAWSIVPDDQIEDIVRMTRDHGWRIEKI